MDSFTALPGKFVLRSSGGPKEQGGTGSEDMLRTKSSWDRAWKIIAALCFASVSNCSTWARITMLTATSFPDIPIPVYGVFPATTISVHRELSSTQANSQRLRSLSKANAISLLSQRRNASASETWLQECDQS
ncbi:hypothetical protein CVT26_012855 [Gymnopilus dilepis]|uniref:Uncharacterized protein n=1 Tax=Gymnopilus dilepis TaxID=231916 RepID=A0A409WDQ1_9AGAR|nr:hypothetical protein CVT26_012855 [Gymnopilus dilepis]